MLRFFLLLWIRGKGGLKRGRESIPSPVKKGENKREGRVVEGGGGDRKSGMRGKVGLRRGREGQEGWK